jgi:hypothetical protein
LANRRNIIIALFVVAAVAASVQSLLRKDKVYEEGGRKYTCYNNYVVFKQSHFHLTRGNDLYVLYPEEHWDLYKYSPAFALFFGAFAYLPDFLGLTLWNLLNALLLLVAVLFLPGITEKQKWWILLACLVELVTSMQNEQSNPMMAGLLILAYGLLERDRYAAAALCIVFTAYIKIFGVIGFALFLFYPNKWRLVLYSLAWGIFFFVVPVLVTGMEQFRMMYESWWNMLRTDHSISYGISVMGIIHSWTGIDFNKLYVVAAGAVVLCLPFLRTGHYRDERFRLLMLCSLLIWGVIFNHKAESPTFIIAMAGVAAWFFTGKKNWWTVSLFVMAFILTSLSPTDLFPASIRREYIVPYALKALPCVIIWIIIVFEMLFPSNRRYHEPKNVY